MDDFSQYTFHSKPIYRGHPKDLQKTVFGKQVVFIQANYLQIKIIQVIELLVTL